MICGHCRASRPHLHAFIESAWEEGTFEVVRCLMCGWQISRLIPWKRRAFAEDRVLFRIEPGELEQMQKLDPLEERLLNFASKAQLKLNPYLGPRF
jgi:hypothetical protein